MVSQRNRDAETASGLTDQLITLAHAGYLLLIYSLVLLEDSRRSGRKSFVDSGNRPV